MKQRILIVATAVVSLCLFIWLSAPPLENTRLGWINWPSLTGGKNFYFKKRQWLADVRTIAAGVRYLYESRTEGHSEPMDVVSVTHSLPLRSEVSTNISRIERTDS
jgi:hypothetical protein